MYEVTERVLAEQPTAVVRRRLEVPQIEGWIGSAFHQVLGAVTAAGSTVVGPPFARYHKVAATAVCFDIEAGFPVATPIESDPDSDVQPSRLPGGPVAATVHAGPYEAMTPAYEALDAWIADHQGTPDGSPWECYLSPPEGPPEMWRTEVVQPYS
jgi:effector-binding domain-containing protein